MEQEICQECHGNGYVVVKDMSESAGFKSRLYDNCGTCDSQGTVPGEAPLSNKGVEQ